jgi:hypothetical protein
LLGSFGGFGEDPGETTDAVSPERLEFVECMAHAAEGVDIGADELLSPSGALADETGALEYRNVLLDRGKAHRVGASEDRDRRLAVHRPAEDVPPRRVGERVEETIDPLLRVIDVRTTIYNHIVVD